MSDAARRRRLLSAQVKERALRLVDLQRKVRGGVLAAQRELSQLQDRQYKKAVRLGDKLREDMAKDAIKRKQKEQEAYFKTIAAWRKYMLTERPSDIREATIGRNRAVMKLHERMRRDHERQRVRNANAAAGAAANNEDYLRRVEVRRRRAEEELCAAG